MPSSPFRTLFTLLLAILALASGLAMPALGAREPVGDRSERAGGDEEFQAARLLAKAEDLLTVGEDERGIKMLQVVLEQFPDSKVRFKAYLALGRHFLDQRDYANAIGYLKNVQMLKKPDEELRGDDLELYLESLYLTGTGYFQMRQFSSAFPTLRKITDHYPNTVWANQAYYYIGMCHFAQSNWQKAIDNLSLVGTFVDPDSPTTEYVEAGRRLYIKLEDADLPILNRLGKPVTAEVRSESGDKATVHFLALSGKSDVFLGSLATEVAPVNTEEEDYVLQVRGGDTLYVKYLDDNTRDGEKDLPREKQVKVVSTGSVAYTLGDYETEAPAAFQNQPLFVVVHDADKDLSDGADTAGVRIFSRYKVTEEEALEEGSELDLETLFEDQEERWEIRDELELPLTEFGTGSPRHNARFTGSVRIVPPQEESSADKSDQELVAALDDEVLVVYTDDLHVGGETPREVSASLKVVGELDSRPVSTQDVVVDAELRAKKNLVEGTAYLELAKIFKSMGLVKGAYEKADVGLEHVADIIRSTAPIPSALREEAFKLKWELHLLQDDYKEAMATCNVFNQLFPESPFVDQALLGIGDIKLEAGAYREAIDIYNRILNLENSLAKAEAAYKIAQATELDPAKGPESAIPFYKTTAERYPDSEFAGPSLAKLVDYYIEKRDYSMAHDLLGRVVEDYQDADFLDAMLLKWVLVSYRRGDFQLALEKCDQLIFQYPESEFAAKAKELRPKIEARAEPA